MPQRDTMVSMPREKNEMLQQKEDSNTERDVKMKIKVKYDM